MYGCLFGIHAILRKVFNQAVPPPHLSCDGLNLFNREKEQNMPEVTGTWSGSTLICFCSELGGS